MTFLVERLTELRTHVDHLRSLRPKVADPSALERDLSLHNDVLFSLLTISQLVIVIAGEIGARRGLRFGDYTEAVRNLATLSDFPAELVEKLARLPGFRNVLIHEYVAFDLQRAVDAMDDLEMIDEFVRVVARSSDLA